MIMIGIELIATEHGKKYPPLSTAQYELVRNMCTSDRDRVRHGRARAGTGGALRPVLVGAGHHGLDAPLSPCGQRMPINDLGLELVEMSLTIRIFLQYFHEFKAGTR